jgi:hypothetical protein
MTWSNSVITSHSLKNLSFGVLASFVEGPMQIETLNELYDMHQDAASYQETYKGGQKHISQIKPLLESF